MSQNRTEKKVVASVVPFMVNGGIRRSNETKFLKLEIVTEQRGLHTIKYIRGGELGCSRDYVTTRDEEAVRKFVGEHALGLVSLRNAEFKTEEFPIFVTMITAHGYTVMVKVKVTAEQCGDMVKLWLEQYQHTVENGGESFPFTRIRFLRFVQSRITGKVEAKFTPMDDLRPSAPFGSSASTFQKCLYQAVTHWVAHNGHHFICIEQDPMVMTFKLETFGINKRRLISNYDEDCRGAGATLDRHLMDQRTQQYSLPEIKILSNWMATSHDSCVVDNPEDYMPIEVRNSKIRIEKEQNASDLISLTLEGFTMGPNEIHEAYRLKRTDMFPVV